MFIKILLLSLVQAITEFFPVSSSGHLIIVHKLINSGEILNNIAFDVVLHGGSLMAIFLFFYQDIKKIILDLLLNLKQKTLSNDKALMILLGILPAGFIGYFFEDFIDSLRNVNIVIITLFFGAILFLLADKYFKVKKDFSKINFKDSFFIGLFQCLAFIPGMSRSGITIFAGMKRGLSKVNAAKFSFLLATPLLLGAFIKKITDISSITNYNFLILGFILSFIFSLIAIKFLMQLLSRFGLKIFAFYRIILVIIILFLSYV